MTEEQKRLLSVAKGCKTYGGGHYGRDYEIYQHGIDTVIRAIESSIKNPNDTQTLALEIIGKS